MLYLIAGKVSPWRQLKRGGQFHMRTGGQIDENAHLQGTAKKREENR
jgi:hypothetical protein